MNPPPKKRPGQPVLAADWNTIIDALAARTPRPGNGLELVSTPSGFTFRTRTKGAGGSSNVTDCPFGNITKWTEGEGETATTKTGIRGGVVYAGDKVWNVDPQELNLATDGEFLVWLDVGVTANREDGVLLPGLNTSTEPQWRQGAASAGYPDIELPEADSGTGKMIIALGTLKIEEGLATFSKTGCGNLRVTHCPGTLAHLRVP